MRIGIFGGTFNPVHLGHLRCAEEIRQICGLSHIYFVPSARPPHKAGNEIAPPVHRLRMVEQAVADNPCFSASAVELERAGPSYSVDTIRYFLSTFQATHQATDQTMDLAFIVGLDAFLDIETWKDYHTIPELCDIIVTSRPGVSLPSSQSLLPIDFQSVFCYESAARMYTHPSHHTLVLREIIGLDISSSAIRREIQQGHSVRYLVHPAVDAYMAEHALYQRERSLF
jgi:nicotinate-nucleotide adenylyltransferase